MIFKLLIISKFDFYTEIKLSIVQYTCLVYLVMFEIFDLRMNVFDPRITLLDPFDDLDIHVIRIRIEFGIQSYAYHVHLAIFPIFDPK